MAELVALGNSKGRRRIALRFVLLIGVLSFFADFTYEGSRSILGPYLGMLGASATVVGVVTGLGELAGYGLRFVSGRWADASRAYWPITIFGYLVQMMAVPALALTGAWPAAAVLIVLERVGKAIRNPPRDTMLSYAGQEAGGVGWAFGLHEALDQLGAMVGPLAIAAVLARRGDFHLAFAALAIPAAINLVFVGAARLLYPRPQELGPEPSADSGQALPRVYWVYLAGAGLAAMGFADYPLIAYHFARAHVVTGPYIAVFYAVAMGVSGAGSLLFGRLFDRFGFSVLIALTVISALFAPLVFLGGFWVALVGAAIWGLGMGVHESIIPAAVTPMAPGGKRAGAFGLFTAGYGAFWFVGSGLIGFLYDRSIPEVIAFCVVAELAATPFFIWVARHRGGRP
ncbi:MAG: MFS transporter [Caulobacteraceae bacterium]